MLVLKVRCPHCGYTFFTRTIKRVRCLNCLRTFKVVYYDRKKKAYRNRIVKIERGSIQELNAMIANLKFGRE